MNVEEIQNIIKKEQIENLKQFTIKTIEQLI